MELALTNMAAFGKRTAASDLESRVRDFAFSKIAEFFRGLNARSKSPEGNGQYFFATVVRIPRISTTAASFCTSRAKTSAISASLCKRGGGAEAVRQIIT